ncbi:MAG: hypothetical protein M3162_05230 [Thermoproteota archaeon]|nr:hypothetical protein [Thermoproteota archaeon]
MKATTFENSHNLTVIITMSAQYPFYRIAKHHFFNSAIWDISESIDSKIISRHEEKPYSCTKRINGSEWDKI